MYFKSRVEAGAQLAKQIKKRYGGKDCAVVALNDGGVVVGSQIALSLDCPLHLMLTEMIELPREDAAIGAINQDGTFSYNSALSSGEIDEMTGEFRNVIEQQKLAKIAEMNQAAGHGTTLRKALLRNKIVIVVSDGLSDGFPLDIAYQFLKPIHIKKMIAATPMASVKAVDVMHIFADDIYCLSVPEDFISVDHYYERQDVPTHEKVIEVVEKILHHWHGPHKAEHDQIDQAK